MTLRPEALIDELRDAEADYRMNLTDGRDRLIAAAVDLVGAGARGSGVIAMAGDDRAQKVEFDRDLDAALRELGLQPLPNDDAAARAARTVALALIGGRASWDVAAKLVWRLWTRTECGPGPLAAFASMADEFGYSPRQVSEDDFRQAAEEYLAALEKRHAG